MHTGLGEFTVLRRYIYSSEQLPESAVNAVGSEAQDAAQQGGCLFSSPCDHISLPFLKASSV